MNEQIMKFEADEQRQHARYKLPLKVVIGGLSYDVLDWSVAGIGVATGKTAFKQNGVVDIKLQFPFEGMDFGLDLQAEVCYNERALGRTGMRYTKVGPEQRRLLRYIVEAYISGEILSAGEILDLNRRSVEAKGRSGKAVTEERGVLGNIGHFLGNIVRFGLVTVLLVGLLTFVGSSIIQRMSVIPAQSGFVSIDLAPVLAANDGTLTNLASGSVTVGQPVATVLTANGNSQTQLSPCDCTVESASIALDTQVTTGDTLALLRPVDNHPYVVALVDRSVAVELYRGVTAQVELLDGTIIPNAKVISLPRLTAANPDAPVPVSIDVGAAADSLTIGEPLDVRFVRENFWGVSLWRNASDFFGRIFNMGSQQA